MKKKLAIIILSVVLVLSAILVVACDTTKGEFKFIASTSAGVSVGNDKNVLPTNIPETAETPTVQIHYWRADADDYSEWGFWLWTESGSVKSDDKVAPYCWPLNYQDDYGAVAMYSLDELNWDNTTEKMGIIAKKQTSTWTKDVDADRFIDLAQYPMDEHNYYHVYLYQGDKNMYKSVDELMHGVTATFLDETQIKITARATISHLELREDDKIVGEGDHNGSTMMFFNFAKGKQPDITKSYTLKAVFKDDNYSASYDVDIISLYETEMFNELNYDGELGAIYSAKKTEFKVWSPVSTKIILNIYEKGDGSEKPKTYEMKKGKKAEKSVFSVTVKGDLAGKYYTYTVYNSAYPTGAEIVDPYAKSAGLNGKRGMIVNFADTNPDGWNDVKAHAYDANELVVWETHVADVTSSSTWTGTEAYRKKFLGMIESGTTYTEGSTTVKTGFDHIKELGVNAVQLVPIFDQANTEVEGQLEFNWGYNPLNYNVLEGSYSTNAADGYVRIKEFKQLVQKFNGAGINIIMDVVYNHVNSAVGSNFDVLMPGYYYRYTESGDMSNGSGCGNETASNHYMFRKFMVDSVCFWAKEYKLGGFRFDLMGLHDLETMDLLAAKLKEINPSIVIYGEPWTGGGTTLSSELQAKQSNANKYQGYGQFNDQMRDALIAGGMKGADELGWITETKASKLNNTLLNKITDGLKGFTRVSATSVINDLYKTVNYVTCHDNYTLHDRIIATGQFGNAEKIFNGTLALTEDNELTIKRMAMLANSVVFTSNGVNFMLAGEEMLRSKAAGGAVGEQIHNSYNASYKVNELDYSLKIANADMFANYQKLIAFKRMFVSTFGLTGNDAVASKYVAEASSDHTVITVTVTAANGTTWKVIHASGASAGTTVDLTGYTLYLDTLGVSGLTLGATTPVLPYQTIIASK